MSKVYTLKHTRQPEIAAMPRSRANLKVIRPVSRAASATAPAAGTVPARGRAAKAAAAGNGGSSLDGNSTHRIVESITAAIVERRLMPGTKLAE